MNKRSKDYIPRRCEIEVARDEALERSRSVTDPRHEYVATYKINGSEYTENVMAYSMQEAEEQVRQQLGMVGWIPAGLKITSVGNTNVMVS